MTMHLLGPQFSTISTKKRKKKLTDNQYHKMCMDWREYNKQMKRCGLDGKTLDEYIAYRQGKYKPELKGNPMPKYEISNHRDKYPSGDGIGTTYARKEKVYTGTLIKGIATMHKSNAVPIINKEQAIDIANMRRG
jgi:hypothetical protein